MISKLVSTCSSFHFSLPFTLIDTTKFKKENTLTVEQEFWQTIQCSLFSDAAQSP